MDLDIGTAIRLPKDNLEAAFVFQPFGGMPQAEVSSAPPPAPRRTKKAKSASAPREPASTSTPAAGSQPQVRIPTTAAPARTVSPRAHPVDPPQTSQGTFATVNQFEEFTQTMTAGLESLNQRMEEREKRLEEREGRLEELRKKEVEDNRAFKESISEAVQIMTKTQAETAKAQAETAQTLQSLLRILAGQSGLQTPAPSTTPPQDPPAGPSDPNA